MRIEPFLNQDIGAISAAPLRRRTAEQDWLDAEREQTIPASLFRLYSRASFLSFGHEPKFLSDPMRLTFSYFAMMLRGLKESLEETESELNALIEADLLIYDRGKELRGEKWEPSAPRKAKRHFKSLLIAVCSSLDCFAELLAMMLPGRIPRLKIGRAEFADVERWLSHPFPDLPSIAAPQEMLLKEMHNVLRPLVCPEGEDKDWLSMTRLLRNKAAHLGTEHFREVGFYTPEGISYTFLPTTWPFTWEQYIRQGKSWEQRDDRALAAIYEALMKQDKMSFARCLVCRTKKISEAGAQILDQCYKEMRDFEPDPIVFETLKKSVQSFAFSAFPTSTVESGCKGYS